MEEKRFHNIDTHCQGYKTFFGAVVKCRREKRRRTKGQWTKGRQ